MCSGVGETLDMMRLVVLERARDRFSRRFAQTMGGCVCEVRDSVQKDVCNLRISGLVAQISGEYFVSMLQRWSDDRNSKRCKKT